jgi:pimeloyl-ACP methyl ester carboxylesterase
VPTFESSDGVEIRYEQTGAGPPVFVCQGGPNNVCDTLIRDLAPLGDSCTLVFHDYRGSGRSAHADPSTYTFERLAGSTIAFDDRGLHTLKGVADDWRLHAVVDT